MTNMNSGEATASTSMRSLFIDEGQRTRTRRHPGLAVRGCTGRQSRAPRAGTEMRRSEGAGPVRLPGHEYTGLGPSPCSTRTHALRHPRRRHGTHAPGRPASRSCTYLVLRDTALGLRRLLGGPGRGGCGELPAVAADGFTLPTRWQCGQRTTGIAARTPWHRARGRGACAQEDPGSRLCRQGG